MPAEALRQSKVNLSTSRFSLLHQHMNPYLESATAVQSPMRVTELYKYCCIWGVNTTREGAASGQAISVPAKLTKLRHNLTSASPDITPRTRRNPLSVCTVWTQWSVV